MPRVTMDISYPPAWCQAARYTGHRHVRMWVHSVVEDFLETGPGRFFPLLPLVWHRGTFQAIRTDDGKTYGPHEVRGCISGPFGVYQGIYLVGRVPGYTLGHIPTGRRLATLDLVRSCKRLAEELAPLRMGWHLDDPEKVGGDDVETVNTLVRKYERDALPPGFRGDRDRPHAGVGGRL